MAKADTLLVLNAADSSIPDVSAAIDRLTMLSHGANTVQALLTHDTNGKLITI